MKGIARCSLALILLLCACAVYAQAQTSNASQNRQALLSRIKSDVIGARYSDAVAAYKVLLSTSTFTSAAAKDSCLNLLALLEMEWGKSLAQTSQFSDALAQEQPALTLFRQVGNKDGQADDLTNMSNAYGELGQYSASIDDIQQALTIHQQVGDKRGQAYDWGDLGITIGELGQYSRAIGCYRQALLISQQIGDEDAQALVLLNIGTAYVQLKQSANAIASDQQAMALFQKVHDNDGLANDIASLGNAYQEQGKYIESVREYKQALPLFEQVGDKDGQAGDLVNLGLAYVRLRQYANAIDCYQSALQIYLISRDKDGEVRVLNNLMDAAKDQSQPRLGIFYGKQAVNIYQRLRAGIQTMDAQTRQTYLNSAGNTYRALADLLIAQGRLPEAQQVLRMLKQTEFYDFLNSSQGQTTIPAPMDSIAWTPHEQRWLTAYNDAPDTSKPVVDARMAADFAKPATSADTLPDTAQAADLAAALKPGTVAVYTIVEPDKLDLIVVTPAQKGKPSRQVYRSSPVSASTLYQQVYDFRYALADPTTDPRPLGGTLYKEVIGPIQTDLDEAHATTVLFSLDDALRYLPIAALYDDRSKHYVVQRYATAIFTLTGTQASTLSPARVPLVLGAGVSQSLDGLPALPGVAEEIGDIVRSPNDPNGLLPGSAMLDSAFTQNTLLGDLGTQRFSFVHLASHFALRPSDTDSYLLMGDGTHLSVAQIAQQSHLFQGVDLLALSACDTDMEVRSSTGKEVEGFGALAQQLGAESVLASLWPVSDAATPLLMTAFYRDLKTHPTWPLARVLQAAQLEMLTGSAAIAEQTVDNAHRGTEMINAPTNLTMPPFTAPSGAPYAHPDYWAPFVLMGNWR